MLDQDMAAALCAITAFADVAAFESGKELFAFRDADVFFLPQREGAHRRGGITSTVSAVTITPSPKDRRALDFRGSAVTLACMRLSHFFFGMAQPFRALQQSFVLVCLRQNCVPATSCMG